MINELKGITDDINFNDKTLAHQVKKSRELIDQVYVDITGVHVTQPEPFADASALVAAPSAPTTTPTLTPIETEPSPIVATASGQRFYERIYQTLKGDFDKTAGQYAVGIETRNKEAIAASASNIYKSVDSVQAQLSNNVASAVTTADTNLDTRTFSLSNQMEAYNTATLAAIKKYQQTNDAALKATNDVVTSHTQFIGTMRTSLSNVQSSLVPFKTSLENVQSDLSKFQTTLPGKLDSLKTELKTTMDTKDQTILKKISDQQAVQESILTTGANTANVLASYLQRMNATDGAIALTSSNLALTSSNLNSMRSNIYVASGRVGIGAFSSNKTPLADLDINNGIAASNTVIRVAGGTEGRLELGAGMSNAKLALDAAGTTMITAPGRLVLQTIGPIVAGTYDTYMQNYKMFVNGTLGIANSNAIELGVGVTGKDVNAGKIMYNTADNMLHITGAGAPNNRKIALDAEAGVNVSGPLTVASAKQLCIGSTCVSEADLKNFRKRIFICTKSDQKFVVPAGVTTIKVKAWGAGGAGGAPGGWTYGSPGGAGGFTTGSLAVTTGQVLTIIVGQGGIFEYGAPIYGGGGYRRARGDNRYCGNGGGRSAVRNGATELLTAGGGGGGGSSRASQGNTGGAGGGDSGVPGASPHNAGYGGKGGTQTAGGIGGAGDTAGNGSQFNGGNGNPGSSSVYGGGGGGGYYGGGSGSFAEPNTMAGGGGGSGYIGGCITNTGTTTAGNGITPPNVEDADYNLVSNVVVSPLGNPIGNPIGIGYGGSAGTVANGPAGYGGDGLVVISW
jgi:hypothetical protein